MTAEKNLTGYPSIDKPWLKYYTKEDLEITVPKCTVYQNIYNRNKDFPDDTAILYYGNKIRYKALFSEVEICAKALRQIGIQPSDCVTLCTAGVPEAIYLVLACSRIGAIASTTPRQSGSSSSMQCIPILKRRFRKPVLSMW